MDCGMKAAFLVSPGVKDLKPAKQRTDCKDMVIFTVGIIAWVRAWGKTQKARSLVIWPFVDRLVNAGMCCVYSSFEICSLFLNLPGT